MESAADKVERELREKAESFSVDMFLGRALLELFVVGFRAVADQIEKGNSNARSK
jgi:hypothetical protein